MLDTGDSMDRVLLQGETTNVIWATDATKPASRDATLPVHNNVQRGAVLLNFFGGEVVLPPPPVSPPPNPSQPPLAEVAPPPPMASGLERSYERCLIVDANLGFKLHWTYRPDDNMIDMAMEKAGEEGYIRYFEL